MIDTVLWSLTWKKGLYHIPPVLIDCPNKIKLGGVSEYYNMTIGVVSSDIISYGSPVEVRNSYTSGSGTKVNPEIQEFYFRTNMI